MDPAPLVAPVEDIIAARAGDRDALGRLWRTYQPQVLRFLRSRRCVAPDDVASQVWIDVGRSFARFDGDGVAFQRWIFTIARNRSIDLARTLSRRNEVNLPGGDEVAAARWRDRLRPDPSDAVVSVDAAIELVSKLPVAQAEAVMLRIVWDLSVADVAEIMQVSEANVRVLTHRGVSRLRDLSGVVEGEIADSADRSVTPSTLPNVSQV